MKLRYSLSTLLIITLVAGMLLGVGMKMYSSYVDAYYPKSVQGFWLHPYSDPPVCPACGYHDFGYLGSTMSYSAKPARISCKCVKCGFLWEMRTKNGVEVLPTLPAEDAKGAK